MPMKVLVIIISYNFEQWIEHCLGSLRQSGHPCDVLVIDNGSQDQTVERVQKEYPEVRLIDNQRNLGFGRANNIGMQIALNEGYEYVFLMNQDAWIDKDTISTLISLSQEHPQYGILSPVHLTGKGDKPDPGFGHYAGIKHLNELSTSKDLLPLPFINAAFWMIPTSVLKKVGGFSPLFYHYGEDKDFVNRIHFHRFLVGYSPKVFGNHDREYRPITRAIFLRTEYVYHLSEYANINYTGWKCFAYGILATWKKAIQSIFKGEFALCKSYLGMSLKLIAKSKKIAIHRKTNKKTNPNYIQ